MCIVEYYIHLATDNILDISIKKGSYKLLKNTRDTCTLRKWVNHRFLCEFNKHSFISINSLNIKYFDIIEYKCLFDKIELEILVISEKFTHYMNVSM